MKLIQIVVLTVLFVALLLVTNYVHMQYFPVNVIFYASIGDACIATGLAGAALLFFGGLTSIEKMQLVVIWLLLGYAYAISVPTVIDRSLSFYIIEKLQQRGGGIDQKRMKEMFISEFIPESRLMDVRLTEQLDSATVTVENGCVKLTAFGKKVATVSRYIRMNLLPKRRLLMGEYSDALTNPFRNSPQGPIGYECK